MEIHHGSRHGISQSALIIAIVCSSIVLVLILSFLFTPAKANHYLSIDRSTNNGKVSNDWKIAFEIVQWEREYIGGYLMPLVGFGMALLAFLYKDHEDSPRLRIAIILLLCCVMLMTIGLGLRNAWVTTGNALAPWQINVDRRVLGPLTAVLFIDAFMLFICQLVRREDKRCNN